MTRDPSGLAVIEALAPQVSRYAEACPGFDKPEMTSEQVQEYIAIVMKNAVSQMRRYDAPEYFDTTGWHKC